MNNKPKDQSAIDKILLFLKNYSSEEDEHGIVRIQIGNILAKELSLAEQRGKLDVLQELKDLEQSIIDENSRQGKGYLIYAKDNVKIRSKINFMLDKLKKGNQTL